MDGATARSTGGAETATIFNYTCEQDAAGSLPMISASRAHYDCHVPGTSGDNGVNGGGAHGASAALGAAVFELLAPLYEMKHRLSMCVCATCYTVVGAPTD
jgi:hypothetical protein